MHAGESSGFWPAFVGIAGALPLLSLLWLYKSGVIAYSQLGAIRTWGCMIILALLALGLAAGLALVGAAVPATRGPRRRSPSRGRSSTRAPWPS